MCQNVITEVDVLICEVIKTDVRVLLQNVASRNGNFT
jgi:hypothetical protein